MMNNSIQAVVITAEQSMQSDVKTTMIAENICGQPMIVFLTKLLASMNFDMTIVLDNQKKNLQEIIADHTPSGVSYVFDKECVGLTKALLVQEDIAQKGHLLIVYGNMPFMTKSTLEAVITEHMQSNAVMTVTVRDNNHNQFDYDCYNQQKNSDYVCDMSFEHMYIVKKDFLISYFDSFADEINPAVCLHKLFQYAQKTDQLINKVVGLQKDFMRIGTPDDLCTANRIKNADLINEWKEKGVRFVHPESTVLEVDVVIGKNSLIEFGVCLKGKTSIGDGCTVRHCSFLENVYIKDQVTIEPLCVIRNSIINSQEHIKPLSYIDHEIQSSSIKNISMRKAIVMNGTNQEFFFGGARLVAHDISTEEL